MILGLGEHGVKIARSLMLVLTLVAGVTAPASAADPRVLQGRWAVDPLDCVDNRYVWVFSNDRAGLFIDNGAVSGWRRASYADTGAEQVAA